LNCCFAPEFAGRAYDAPQDLLVGWEGGYPLPIQLLLNTFSASKLVAFADSQHPPHHTGFTLKYHPGCEYGFNIVNVFFRFCSLKDQVLFRVCLGPLLFLIHINDLVTVYNTNVTPKLYADDSKLYACLSCLDFQQNLDRLTEWTNTW